MGWRLLCALLLVVGVSACSTLLGLDADRLLAPDDAGIDSESLPSESGGPLSDAAPDGGADTADAGLVDSKEGGDDVWDSSSDAKDGAGDAKDSASDGGGKDAAADVGGDTGVVPDAVAAFFSCPSGGRVDDCAACAGHSFPCTRCIDGGAATGFCETNPSCSSLPGERCSCQGSLTCALANEVCDFLSDRCRTCGENGTGGEDCEGPGTCQEGQRACN